MESVKKIKAYLDKRFQKHPIAGYMVYGGLMGFVSSLCLILLVLGVLAITGIYDRLSIDYRTWRLYIGCDCSYCIRYWSYGIFSVQEKGKQLF